MEGVPQGLHGPQVVCILRLPILHQHQSLRTDDLHARHCPWFGIHFCHCESYDGPDLLLRIGLLPDPCQFV